MAMERSHLVTDRRPAADPPPVAQPKTQPLFGNKIRSTWGEIKQLRERRHDVRRDEEAEGRPLFGNQIRETLREIAELRERRRAAKDIARRH